MEIVAKGHAVTPITNSQATRAITIAIVAMGGEGGGVLADWIVDLAEHAGYLAQTTSVPGVAQRTGSTVYYIEIFPRGPAVEAGKAPVLALMPVPGELDIVVASELMEAARAIQRGMVTPDRTVLIASTNRVYSMAEKMALADGQVDSKKLMEAGRAAARSFVSSDFAKIAEETRSVISAPLFGALAATNALPFERTEFEEAILRGRVGIKSSLAGFAAAFDVVRQPPAILTAQKAAGQTKVGAQLKALAARIENSFPAVAHAILLTGIQRLADYQDINYAAWYLDELEFIRELDATAKNGAFTLLQEMARYLALWMSYEDAIRVADLKTRDSRFERVYRESRADATQLVQIREFLHPGVEEMTDIMPSRLGRWLLKSKSAKTIVDKFTRQGRVVHTTSLSGFLQLYFLAALRPWRRKSLRFKEEHKRIKEWLAQVRSVARENYALALELAECPNIVKGYGDTHLRGRKNFDALMTILPRLRSLDNAALTLKNLREAALADDTGEKLGQALRELPT